MAFDGADHPSQLIDLQRIVLDWYRPLFAANVAVDFAHPAQDLGGYRLVVAPGLHLATTETLRALTTYVEAGGALAIGFFSGVVDENDHVRCGSDADVLTRLLGARVDKSALVAGAGGVQFRSRTESIACEEWTRVATGRRRRCSPRRRRATRRAPAVASTNPLGGGVIHYCSAGLSADQHASRAMRRGRGRAAGEQVPEGVEVCQRAGGGRSYLFLLNLARHRRAPAPDGVLLLGSARNAQ